MLWLIIGAMAALSCLSCGQFSFYNVTELGVQWPQSNLYFGSRPYSVLKNEYIGDAVVDSGGTLWSLDVYYNHQKSLSPADIELVARSVRIDFPALSLSRTITRADWRQEVNGYTSSSILLIGPISVPQGYKSEIEVSFELSAYYRCTETLIFTRQCHVLMKR
jgi:hypothetical protein